MKNLRICIGKLTILLVIAYLQFSCNSRKNLVRQSSSSSVSIADERRTREHTKEMKLVNRVVEQRDSSKHLYSIKIVPKDTFTFSVHGGFKGKATTIEVIGSSDYINRILERESSFNVKKADSEHISRSETSSLQTFSTKELIKNKSGRILIIALCLVFLLWVVWKARQTGKFWS